MLQVKASIVTSNRSTSKVNMTTSGNFGFDCYLTQVKKGDGDDDNDADCQAMGFVYICHYFLIEYYGLMTQSKLFPLVSLAQGSCTCCSQVWATDTPLLSSSTSPPKCDPLRRH